MTSKKLGSPGSATASGAPSVLSEGHPTGASGIETIADGIRDGNLKLEPGIVDGKLMEVSVTKSGDPFPTIPQIGAYRTSDHRYYWNGKGPLPSVTSILSVLDKPAVVQWAKRTVAEFAVSSFHNGDFGDKLVDVGDADTVRWLASLPDYQKDEAGKLGSGVHLLADMASRASVMDGEAFQVSDLEKPYLKAFQGFLAHLSSLRAEIVSSEKMVWSSDGYAGTYDLMMRFWTCGQTHDHLGGCGRDLWLVDIKTSKGYYPETALQLVAYGYADQIIVPDNPNPYPMPHIQRYGVLHLRPDVYPDTGWRLIEYPVQDSDYVAFLGALELYRWKQEGRYTKSKLRST